jgi:hypothetical protein
VKTAHRLESAAVLLAGVAIVFAVVDAMTRASRWAMAGLIIGLALAMAVWALVARHYRRAAGR